MRVRVVLPLAAGLAAVLGGVLVLRGRAPAPQEVPAGLRETLYGETGTPAPGQWRAARPSAPREDSLTAEQRAKVEELESIGYLGAVREGPAGSGVVRYDRERAFPGVNFFVSGDGPAARLVDMEGRELHRWSLAFRDVWPDYPVSDDHSGTQYWRRARLAPNGDVVAIFEGLGILRLDRDSRLLWENPDRAHHDLALLPDGRVLVLTREAHVVERIDPEDPIVEDFLSLLDERGREISRVSLLAAFEASPFRNIWYARKFAGGDLFHTNAVSVLDGRLAGVLPAFRKGNVLTSMRYLDALAVVDLEAGEVLWARGGPFRRQHDPRVLHNGHLLVFDNELPPHGSRVLELDPVTFEVVWKYEGTAAEPLFTESCGAAQRLPNGNTLVVESDNGRVVEVTPGGDIVWEYVNPARAGEHGELIATIPDMIRLPADSVRGWLDPPEEAEGVPGSGR